MDIYYFGCSDGTTAGHYWHPHQPRGKTYYTNLIGSIDGLFIRFDLKEGQYVINTVSNMIIISWVDYSVDKRGGSNSNIVGFNYTSEEKLFEDAKVKFPWVFARLKTFEPFVFRN